MVFSSHIFLFYFLPASLLLYYLMPGRGRNFLLTLLSYVFYSWSNPLFCLLMFFSTVVDYCCGWVAGVASYSKKMRKTAVAVSVLTNLGLLSIFKYMGFALENYNSLLQIVGLSAHSFEVELSFLLPLGISFYTFQSMSYTIDVYRGDARFKKNFIDFSCYVSLFPQLVAGPIIRFKEVAEQLQSRIHTVEKFARGVAFFSIGMAKKVLLANGCGKIADLAFASSAPGVIDAWYGAVAYAFQIYFDFSGYSDMAIGLGLMFGFVFPKNFSSPYKSTSITEFWRRWHISLSTWLREYLYFPLGGNRKGSGRTAINLAIVMLLGGLWHGASWNFIIWGALHGIMLGAERLAGKEAIYFRLRRPVRVGLTFLLVVIAWVFFRAETLPQAMNYLGSMFGGVSASPNSVLLAGVFYSPYSLFCMGISALVVWLAPQTWDWTRDLNTVKAAAIFFLLAISVGLLTIQSYNPFIYFNF